MRMLSVVLLLILLLPASLRAASGSEMKSLAVLNLFLADPLEGSPAEVLKIVENSPREVELSNKYLPWIATENRPQGHELLLAAFMAGNLKAQIEKNSPDPQPYAGVLAIIDVYRKIQAYKPGFEVASVDHFIALEKEGKLKAYIESE